MGKGGRCVGLTTFAPSCTDFHDYLGVSSFWNPHGLSKHVAGIALPFSLRREEGLQILEIKTRGPYIHKSLFVYLLLPQTISSFLLKKDDWRIFYVLAMFRSPGIRVCVCVCVGVCG